MGSNKSCGIEEVECGKDTYLFKADFSFAAAVKQTVGDPLKVYQKFASEECDPEQIKGVLCCSIKQKNGEDIKNKEEEVEDLVTRNGLQECLFLCDHLLAYAIIGDVKKSKLRRLKPNKLTELLTEPFMLESSRNRRLLWVYHLMNSGICVCTSFSLFVLLFVYYTDFARTVLTLVK